MGDVVQSVARREALLPDDTSCDVPSRGPGFFLTDSVIIPSLVLRGKI
jgi:hypothetical protein